MPKILCIEDEDILREDLVEELTEAGYEVFEASDGRSGHSAILDHTPDLVLCDISMPDMSGYELLVTLRDNHPEFDEVPFVFLSALADRKDVIKGKTLGADDYLTKPIDFELLLATLDSRLRQITRMTERKEEQLLRLYRALSQAKENNGGNPESAPSNSVAPVQPMNVVAVVDQEFDLQHIRAALEDRGHTVTEMNSGKQFVDSHQNLKLDLLLLSFNTSDMQGPMIVRLLRDANYPKVLLIPPSMGAMDKMDTLPGFDAAIRWPCAPSELEERIAALAAEPMPDQFLRNAN